MGSCLLGNGFTQLRQFFPQVGRYAKNIVASFFLYSQQPSFNQAEEIVSCRLKRYVMAALMSGNDVARVRLPQRVSEQGLLPMI